MDQRMIVAVVISSGVHAIFALVISTASPPESNAFHVLPKTLLVRLVSAERVLAESQVSRIPEQVAALESVLASQAGGGADRHVVSVASGSVLPNDIGESHASVHAAPLLPVEVSDLDTSTTAPVKATVISQEELDAQPVPIDPVIPVYPSEELAASAGGLIKLQLLIDEVGRIIAVDVLETGLPVAFGVSATAAFERVRFRPGLRNGLPVRCRVITSIQFAPTALAQMATARRDDRVGLRE